MPPKSKDTEVLWSDIAGRILVNTLTHPIEYAKVLIQIGYEPIPPKPTVTLFGRPALKLPNIFTYIGHIKSTDGFMGCYRGLMPKVCSYTVSTIAYDKTLEYLQLNLVQNEDEDEDGNENELVRRKKCIREIIRDVISRTIAIVVSHPLEVISLRMMAQFVGGETKYSSLFGSFLEIYRENGIQGYYAGLIPRVIGSAAAIILAGVSTYAINNYVIQEMKPYTASSMKFLATTVMYPFLVVSHCMAVNDCGLVAGVPPYMPIYKNWLHCWSHLSVHNQLKRGSSLFLRYYTGQQMLLNGKVIPIMSDNFYQPSP
ncbi:mitochondrial carrier homolog 2 [Anoplolepis gracilipes]|uniref:mitochondrial carrier homolog 2 n=1 Tax=Anoplolepis gracilipes TaxID=354296 RepID=UPI003BA20274